MLSGRGEEPRPPANGLVNEPSWLGKLLEHHGLANMAIANCGLEPSPL